jgi:hypothetical protein
VASAPFLARPAGVVLPVPSVNTLMEEYRCLCAELWDRATSRPLDGDDSVGAAPTTPPPYFTVLPIREPARPRMQPRLGHVIIFEHE